MRQHLHRILILTAALTTFPAVSADEITEQIDVGLKAYTAGEMRRAVEELQYAIAQIQEKLNAEYTKLMPDALEGWSAEEAQAQSAGMAMMGGGTQVSRRYAQNDTKASVEIKIMADSPFLQAMSMMLSNPMMIQSDPNTKLYRHGKFRGMIKHPQNSKRWEISLMVANRILVQVAGDRIESQAPAETYLKAVDFQAVEQAFAQ